jgi:hypothetical protein
MPYNATDQLASSANLYDNVNAALYVPTTTTALPFPTGFVIRGLDQALGGGEFIFGKCSEALLAGDVVELTTVFTSGNGLVTAQKWRATTASIGQQLGVAMAALSSGNFGFFQVQGNAIVNSNGVTAAGDRAFWQANGVVSTTLVAGKQALGMNAMSAANATVTGYGAIGATKSVYMLQRPFGQGNIT